MISKIFKHIKNRTFFKTLFVFIYHNFLKYYLYKFFPIKFSRYIYFKTYGRIQPKIDSPLSEKLHFLKIQYFNNSFAKNSADKLEVRNYIKTLNLDLSFPFVQKVFNSRNEIIKYNLNSDEILKSNHFSGNSVFPPIKSKKTIRLFLKSLRKDYSNTQGEMQYRKIRVQSFIELKLSSPSNTFPLDYKFWCFNGKAEFLYVSKKILRGINKITIRGLFNSNWESLNYFNEKIEVSNDFEKPHNLREMFLYASIISQPFAFARVDFYEVERKIYFGEITLTPFAGKTDLLFKESIDKELGKKVLIMEA